MLHSTIPAWFSVQARERIESMAQQDSLAKSWRTAGVQTKLQTEADGVGGRRIQQVT